MLDKFWVALATVIGNAVENALVRIADKKIPDDTVPQLLDRVVGVVQTTADRIAGSAEAELGQLGTEIKEVVEAANPLDLIGRLFGRR